MTPEVVLWSFHTGVTLPYITVHTQINVFGERLKSVLGVMTDERMPGIYQ